MQVDLKVLQQKREERFKNSLFQTQPQNQSDVDAPKKSEVPLLSNENYVQIYVKCTIAPEFVAVKEPKEATEEPDDDNIEIVLDDVIENEELGMKKEFNVFVERDLVPQIKLLKQNYIEKQDLIKMPVCGSNGIRLPEESDFLLYFQFFKVREKATEASLLVQSQEMKLLFGLLMCGCIFQDEFAQELAFKFITKKATLELLIKLLLITAQYESTKYQMYVYKLVKQLLYFHNGILKDVLDPILKEVVTTMRASQLLIEPPSTIKIVSKQFNLKINTTFLFPLHKQYERERGEIFKPIHEYSQYQVLRNADIHDEIEQSEYPHIYIIRKESSQQLAMVAYQADSHSEMWLFDSTCEKYVKYNDHYVGCVDRNIWGTSFKIFDDGYHEDKQFPDWIGSKRKLLMKIEYETNIMASQPRYFDTVFLNLETKKFENLITLKPKYNPERDCYQLHFYGRAKIPSARNFQLIKENDEATIYLLHGKMDRNLFNLDFRPPLSLIQAFSISIVSISAKALVS